MSKPRLIAFYLPQFYPTKENDKWWSPGFTEWTNVGRAKPLFPGHYQPRVPADLGYYDLRVPETREKQAELAREAGIEGFCYWHYWFAGRRLLDRVFTEVVESGKPDFPFCLCWANHSWYKKIWDPSKGKDQLLIEQTYPGEQDYIEHFNAMLPAFKDPRYMKRNGKLIFGLFSPDDVPDLNVFKNVWNKLAKENGLGGFYFFGRVCEDKNIELLNNGLDAVSIDYAQTLNNHNNSLTKFLWKVWYKLFEFPKINTYKHYTYLVLQKFKDEEGFIPMIVPNFDHSPRSRARGVIIIGSTPERWKEFLKKIFRITSSRPQEENIILIKSWNEWGEGNYMEPDLKYGKGFIKATHEAIKGF